MNDSASIGARFHYETGFGKDGPKGKAVHGADIPLYKIYDGVPKYKLPPSENSGLTVEKAIQDRHSVRSFTSKSPTLKQISRLLLSADGLTHAYGTYAMRSAPSGGALYPIDIYLVTTAIDSLPDGLYHFQVSDSTLELVKPGSHRDQLYEAASGQDCIRNAPLSVIMTARFARATKKYADRGYRYTYMESGAICENIYLQAASLGLGTVAVGAFIDDAVNALLKIDGSSEAALLIMPIGYPVGE
jgi:SagB-type dehydrogenase family enzyme